jgi:hypothetical protein
MNLKGYWTTIGAAYELQNYIDLQSSSECYKSNFSSHSYYWSTINPKMLAELQTDYENHTFGMIIRTAGLTLAVVLLSIIYF